MPTNTKQSRQAKYSLVLGPFFGNKGSGGIGTSMARFYAPSGAEGKGLVVRSIKMWNGKAVGTPGAVLDVFNGSTSMLDSTLTFTSVTFQDAVLANDGTEIVGEGGHIRVSGVESGANKWDSTVQALVTVQINYDLL